MKRQYSTKKYYEKSVLDSFELLKEFNRSRKKWTISDFEKYTNEQTNGGPMKRSLLDFVGYGMTKGGPMKRP